MFATRRPVATTDIVIVEAGRLQVRCTCRWHSRRVPLLIEAWQEEAMHLAACGLCVRLGRDWMDVCECLNCQHRRAMERTRRTAIQPTHAVAVA